MTNIYYEPAAFGLMLVEEVDVADGYEFDKFVVWQKVDGPKDEYLWATDSGCSCPTPFDYEDMTTLEHGPLDRLNAAYREWRDSKNYYSYTPPMALGVSEV